MDGRVKSKYAVASCLITQYEYAKEKNPSLTIAEFLSEIVEITTEMELAKHCCNKPEE